MPSNTAIAATPSLTLDRPVPNCALALTPTHPSPVRWERGLLRSALVLPSPRSEGPGTRGSRVAVWG